MLANLNIHRANHSAPAFTWNDDLASAAQVLTDSCVWAHDTTIAAGDMSPYGQNLAGTFPGDPGYSVDMWYNDEMENWPESAYGANIADWPAPGFYNGNYGHFTQVVWVASTEVGCAKTVCNINQPGVYVPVYIACNFYPAGNVLNPSDDTILKNNVLPPLGNPYVADICGPSS